MTTYTHVPESELASFIEQYAYAGYEVVDKIDQGGGLWTVRFRKKAAPAATASAARQPAATGGAAPDAGATRNAEPGAPDRPRRG